MSGELALSILRRLIESHSGNALSPAAAEADEYDAYIAAADWLSLWKSKARLGVKQLPTGHACGRHDNPR